MGERPVNVLIVKERCRLLPQNIAETVADFTTSAGFRGASTLTEQICQLRELMDLDYDSIAIALGKVKSTVYRKYQAFLNDKMPKEVQQTTAAEPQGEKRTSPTALLTKEQEQEVVEWIRQKHGEFDCPTPTMVRQYAATKLNPTNEGNERLSRFWWHGFKVRHSDELETKVISSIESGRVTVHVEQVHNYVGKLLRAVATIKSPRQILNFDETGFHSRIDKGSKRKCVCMKGPGPEPKFRESSQSTTVSLVATINMMGEALTPLFLCKESVQFRSRGLQLLKNRLFIFQTQKGYQTEDSMLFYLDNVIQPYIYRVQEEVTDSSAKVYLIMDQCSSHMTPKVKETVKRMNGLKLIKLPPHSSHFTQPLDVSLFGTLKLAFRSTRTPPEKPKYEAKIVRAYNAWQRCCIPGNIVACFQKTGIDYRYPIGDKFEVVLNLRKVVEMMRVHCCDYERVFDLPEWDKKEADRDTL